MSEDKIYFKNLNETIKAAYETRLARDGDSFIRYSISFLDDCLKGILTNELVVIGADSGIGKTQLVNDIAFFNATCGKNVFLFSLEGDDYDAVYRWQWQLICDEYYKKPDGKEMSYQKYLLNDLSDIEKLEETAMANLSDLCGEKLHLFTRQMALKYENLLAAITAAVISGAQLIIIDHLHYLPMSSEEAEHAQLSHIVRAVKEAAKASLVPIILVSHLKKKTKDRGLPDLEDLHGSSNIAKEADTVILISEAENLPSATKRATHFRIAKSRNSAPKQFIGKVYFDTEKRRYAEKYKIEAFTKGGLKELSGIDVPAWAKRAEI